MGSRLSMAMCCARSCFLTVIGYIVPPFTVASLAITTASRPVNVANAGHQSRRGRVVLVHVVGGERRELEERRSRIDEPVDALAHQQLAAFGVPPARLRRAPLARCGQTVAKPGDLFPHSALVLDELRRAGAQVRSDAFHGGVSLQQLPEGLQTGCAKQVFTLASVSISSLVVHFRPFVPMIKAIFRRTITVIRGRLIRHVACSTEGMSRQGAIENLVVDFLVPACLASRYRARLVAVSAQRRSCELSFCPKHVSVGRSHGMPGRNLADRRRGRRSPPRSIRDRRREWQQRHDRTFRVRGAGRRRRSRPVARRLSRRRARGRRRHSAETPGQALHGAWRPRTRAASRSGSGRATTDGDRSAAAIVLEDLPNGEVSCSSSATKFASHFARSAFASCEARVRGARTSTRWRARP